MSEMRMKDFCDLYDLENLIEEPKCFKNPNNPSSIDLMLTNRKSSFCNSRASETGLSDCHKMTVSVLKMYIKKKNRNMSTIDATRNLFKRIPEVIC